MIKKKYVSLNPFTNTLLKEFEFVNTSEIESMLSKSYKGYKHNESISLKERLSKIERLSSMIETNITQYANLISTEIGKPISESMLELKKSRQQCQYYMDNAIKHLRLQLIKTEAKKSYIEYSPLGVIYSHMPFCSPFLYSFKFIIPILISGNSILARFSESNPIVALAIDELLKGAGFDSGEYQNIFSSFEQNELIIKNSVIQGVSFSGAQENGIDLAFLAGKYLKKSIIEINGSNYCIVRKDADLKKSVNIVIKNRLTNAGQDNFSINNFLIDESIYDDFVKLLIHEVKEIKIGDPSNFNTKLGSLANSEICDNLEKKIDIGIVNGARLLYGETKRQLNSLNFNPIILEIDNLDNNLINENIIGPVFCLIKTKNDDQSIEIVNKSKYGFGTIILTNDVKKTEYFKNKIRSGIIIINEELKYDSRLSYGGCKLSGYGRIGGEIGIKEFTNNKLVYIK